MNNSDNIIKIMRINDILSNLIKSNKIHDTLDSLYYPNDNIYINPITKENIKFPLLNTFIITVLKKIPIHNPKDMLKMCNKHEHNTNIKFKYCKFCHNINEQKIKIYIRFFNEIIEKASDDDISNILEYVTIFLILCFPTYNKLINVKKICSYIGIINISTKITIDFKIWNNIIKECYKFNIHPDFIYVLLSFVSLLDTRTKKCQKQNCDYKNNCNFICTNDMWKLCHLCLHCKISNCTNNHKTRHYKLPLFTDKSNNIINSTEISNNNIIYKPSNTINLTEILNDDLKDSVIYDILIKNKNLELLYSNLSNICKNYIDYKIEHSIKINFMDWLEININNFNLEIIKYKKEIEYNLFLLEELQINNDLLNQKCINYNIQNIKIQSKIENVEKKIKYMQQYLNIIKIMKNYNITYSQAKCYYLCIFNNSIGKYIPITIVIYAFTVWNGTNAYSLVKGIIELYKELFNCDCEEIRELKNMDINDNNFIATKNRVYNIIINFLSSMKIYGFENNNFYVDYKLYNDEWDIISNNIMNYIFDNSNINIKIFINFLKNGYALWLFCNKYKCKNLFLSHMENISMNTFKELFEDYLKIDNSDGYKLVLSSKNKISISSRYTYLKSKKNNISKDIITNIIYDEDIINDENKITLKKNKPTKQIPTINKKDKINKLDYIIKTIKIEKSKNNKSIHKILNNIATTIGFIVTINNIKYVRIDIFSDEYLNKVKNMIDTLLDNITTISLKNNYDSDSDSYSDSKIENKNDSDSESESDSKSDSESESESESDSESNSNTNTDNKNKTSLKIEQSVVISKPKKIYSKKDLKEAKLKYKQAKIENKKNKSPKLKNSNNNLSVVKSPILKYSDDDNDIDELEDIKYYDDKF